jgi:precorrin-3B methylase
MVFQFQVGVTLLYIIWSRAIPITEEADHAIRDCMSVLAIYADRSKNAEHYRDCLELLATSASRSFPIGLLNEDIREKLAVLLVKVKQVGIALYVSEMISEMCGEGNHRTQRA